MPTGSGKSSLCKYLRKLVEDARSQNGTGDSEPSWFLDDQSFEKMGALMCDNSWKLLGLYDELPMFLSQINVFRGRGLADSHELALLLQLYGGSQWVRKTGKLSNLNGYGYIIHVHARAYTHYTVGRVLIASIYYNCELRVLVRFAINGFTNINVHVYYTQGKWVSNTAPYLCRTCHKDGTITENRADLHGAVHIPY